MANCIFCLWEGLTILCGISDARGAVHIHWWSLFTNLESAFFSSSVYQGDGKLGRKPDPESALRGFKIPELTWLRVVSCWLASTNQNGIGRWLPLIQALKMGFTRAVSPLRKDHSKEDRRMEIKKCLNPVRKGDSLSPRKKTLWTSLYIPIRDWLALESKVLL